MGSENWDSGGLIHPLLQNKIYIADKPLDIFVFIRKVNWFKNGMYPARFSFLKKYKVGFKDTTNEFKASGIGISIQKGGSRVNLGHRAKMLKDSDPLVMEAH